MKAWVSVVGMLGVRVTHSVSGRAVTFTTPPFGPEFDEGVSLNIG